MGVLQRAGSVALFVCLAGLTAGWIADWQPLGAGSRPVPARTAQGTAPASPEPPLADPSLGSAPVSPPAPKPAIDPQSLGSPCPADPPTPVVSIRVRVPAIASAGQELEYRLCVENASRAAAHHVTVRN